MRMRRGTLLKLDRTRTRLHHRIAVGAERTLGWIPRRNAERFECRAGDADVGAATAAVDDRTGHYRYRTCGANDIDHFFRAAAGSDDVFHNSGAGTGFEREAPAQRHAAVGIAFGKEEGYAKRPRHFVTDDEA